MPGGACLPLHACAALAIAHAGDSCTQAQANRLVRVRYSGKAALSDGLELDEQRPRFNLHSRIKKAAFKVGRSTQRLWGGCKGGWWANGQQKLGRHLAPERQPARLAMKGPLATTPSPCYLHAGRAASQAHL